MRNSKKFQLPYPAVCNSRDFIRVVPNSLINILTNIAVVEKTLVGIGRM